MLRICVVMRRTKQRKSQKEESPHARRMHATMWPMLWIQSGCLCDVMDLKTVVSNLKLHPLTHSSFHKWSSLSHEITYRRSHGDLYHKKNENYTTLSKHNPSFSPLCRIGMPQTDLRIILQSEVGRSKCLSISTSKKSKNKCRCSALARAPARTTLLYGPQQKISSRPFSNGST
jgi:hypothetical protein